MKKTGHVIKKHKLAFVFLMLAFLAWFILCGLPAILRLIFGPFDPDIESMKMGEQVLELFDERDKEGMKALFSNKIREYEDLDAQIEAAFDFFEGNIEEYPYGTEYLKGGSQQTWDHHRIVKFYLEAAIKDIKTTANRTYDFSYCYYFSYKRNEDWEGMMSIRIKDGDREVEIGRYYTLRE